MGEIGCKEGCLQVVALIIAAIFLPIVVFIVIPMFIDTSSLLGPIAVHSIQNGLVVAGWLLIGVTVIATVLGQKAATPPSWRRYCPNGCDITFMATLYSPAPNIERQIMLYKGSDFGFRKNAVYYCPICGREEKLVHHWLSDNYDISVIKVGDKWIHLRTVEELRQVGTKQPYLLNS